MDVIPNPTARNVANNRGRITSALCCGTVVKLDLAPAAARICKSGIEVVSPTIDEPTVDTWRSFRTVGAI